MDTSRTPLPWNQQQQKRRDFDVLRYLPLDSVLRSANRCFGKDRWSSEHRSQKVLGVEQLRNGTYNVMVQTVVRVTVHPEDGEPFWREDVGIGLVQRAANEFTATALAIKWASTDGLKRALRLFSDMVFSGADGEESRGDRDGDGDADATASSVSLESGGGDPSPEAKVFKSFPDGKQGRKRPGSSVVSRGQMDVRDMFSSVLVKRRCGRRRRPKSSSDRDVVCLDSQGESGDSVDGEEDREES